MVMSDAGCDRGGDRSDEQNSASEEQWQKTQALQAARGARSFLSYN
jgi:hypothetical protein